MKFLIEFVQQKDVENTAIFPYLKCSADEARILQYLTIAFLKGEEGLCVRDIITALFASPEESYQYLLHLENIKHLLELGWISQLEILPAVLSKIALLELLSTSITLTDSFLKLLEMGEVVFELPEIVPYSDHLEYLKDQFLRIDLLFKVQTLRENHTQNSPSLNDALLKLKLIEECIEKKIHLTQEDISIEQFFKEHNLNSKEKTIFLVLLKEEYSHSDEKVRDINSLINLISTKEVERISNRSLLDEHSPLVEKGLLDFDEVISPFGGIARTFFIPEDILYQATHLKKKKAQKVKLDILLKEQDIFEFIELTKDIDHIVLHPKTEEILKNLLQQMNVKVLNLLKEWGIKDKKSGIEAKIIFHGPAGTGKTITAKALAKSLKRPLLSLDCSKILSSFVGESEKNVRKIFDTYKNIAQNSKLEPILFLDEADQFLSTRTQMSVGGAEKMHNQMQNIFLEQIEKFSGILIATTNLLESIDSAFSRRFNYKIEFKKPKKEERLKLWDIMLPKNAVYEEHFDIEKLAQYPLTGGQIHIIVQNTAYKVAARENTCFYVEDFLKEIFNEKVASFDSEKVAGFLG